MNEYQGDPINLVTYVEAAQRAKDEKKDQILYVWNIKDDSYDYVIASTDDAMPEVVQSPYITRPFTYKENPHE